MPRGLIPRAQSIVIAIGLFNALCCAQTNAAKNSIQHRDKQQASPSLFEIEFSPANDYPPLPWSEDQPDITQSSECTGDKNVYLAGWPIGMAGTSFTRNGIIRFSKDQMADIPLPEPMLLGSVSQAGYFVRVGGTENAKMEEQTFNDEEGHESRYAEVKGDHHEYIAHFDKDGSYKGAIKTELPFDLVSFGVFDSGNFVAQGLDQNKIPRIGLLDSSCQLIRYLDLPNDISTARAMSGKDFKLSGGQASIGVVVMLSGLTLSTRV